MKVELTKSFRFEAAHKTLWQGDAQRLHGHSYNVDLILRGVCDPNLGWLVDYAHVSDEFDDLYDQLDHRSLDEVEGLDDTTTDGLGRWIFERMRTRLDALREVRVEIIGKQNYHSETVDAARGLPKRLRFGFEAAHALPNLPETHKCRRMHGHSFVVEVAADQLPELSTLLYGVYDGLDHRCLNEVEGLENPTSEEISRWIWNAIRPSAEAIRAVTVAETCTARCTYRGD